MIPAHPTRRRATALAMLMGGALIPAGAAAQRVEGSFQRTLTVSGGTGFPAWP